VFLPSPNNPTGTLLSTADVEAILREDTLLVVDEAYVDFCDWTALPLLAEHPNLVVMRTFSKW
jgi:histidinol-phosphate aminotransferase